MTFHAIKKKGIYKTILFILRELLIKLFINFTTNYGYNLLLFQNLVTVQKYNS